MPEPIDPLDPFKNEQKTQKSEYKTKDIRRSFSRTARDLLMNVISIGKKSPHILILIAGALAIAVIVIVGLTSTSTSTPTVKPASSSESTKPSGKSQSSGDVSDDSETQASEQEKLSTVIALISDEDWENAAALIETISPKILNDCNKLYYYRSVSTISDHFDSLSVSKDVAEMHIEQLENACVVTNE